MPFTEAELIERRKTLGASECAAALGMSNWYTRLELFLSKKGRAAPIETTLPMRVGIALEPVVIEQFEEEEAYTVFDRQKRFVDPKCEWRTCTVDGLVRDVEGLAIVEAKTSGDYRGWGDDPDAIPVPYLYNLHHSFICVPEAKFGFVPVLVGGRDFKTYRVNRDEELITLVRLGEEHFMNFVRTDVEPPPTNNEDLKLLYPHSKAVPIVATKDMEAIVANLAKIKSERKALEKREEDVGFEVRSYMAQHDTLLDSVGKPIATWKGSSRTVIDVKSLREHQPQIAAAYSKTTPTRTLLIK